MSPEIEDHLTVEEIRAAVKETLPPKEEIREMISNYGRLTEEQRLIVDSYYFTRAANVSDSEAQQFYFFWGKGERVYPEIVDEEHPVFCPVWRMRLALLGKEAQKHFLYVIWGERA